MPKYKIEVDWTGYSRGIATYTIDAENEDEARELYNEGEQINHQVIRDDTEDEIVKIEEI